MVSLLNSLKKSVEIYIYVNVRYHFQKNLQLNCRFPNIKKNNNNNNGNEIAVFNAKYKI